VLVVEQDKEGRSLREFGRYASGIGNLEIRVNSKIVFILTDSSISISLVREFCHFFAFLLFLFSLRILFFLHFSLILQIIEIL